MVTDSVRAEIEEALIKLWWVDRETGFAIRYQKPNGTHRLTNLADKHGITQEQLAEILARRLERSRRHTLGEDQPILSASTMFNDAWKNEGKIIRLAKSARNDLTAWEACQLYFDPKLRPQDILMDDKGMKYQADMPLPRAIKTLAYDYFTGAIEEKPKRRQGRPKEKHEARDVSIRASMWAALESSVKATSGEVNACSIVGEIYGEKYSAIKEIWGARKEKRTRT